MTERSVSAKTYPLTGDLDVSEKARIVIAEELSVSGLNNLTASIEILPINTVGVAGDNRTYGKPLLLTFLGTNGVVNLQQIPPEILDQLLAKTSTRITNEIKEITRVVWEIPTEKK